MASAMHLSGTQIPVVFELMILVLLLMFQLNKNHAYRYLQLILATKLMLK